MTTPASPPDWDAIARYLSGESPPEEAATVRAWLDANPGDRDLVERLNRSATIESAADVDVETALRRVHQRMAEPARVRLTLERGGAAEKKRHTITWFVAAAAAALLIVATRSRLATPSKNEPRTARHYVTGVGKRDSILLDDGSRVILGPRSRLEVPADYGALARAVTLAGDAYLDVRHDAAKPFSVRINGALIEDIGTTFVVESDAANSTTVAVITGSVRLRRESAAGNAGVVLVAGDRGTLEAAGEARVQRHSVRGEDTAWLSGRLQFRDAPLSQVAAEIERWYGVRLQLADSAMLAQHVTTSLDGEGVDQALRILGLTIGARIEHVGDSAIVTSTRGRPTSR
jgi:transmembrane sensor